MSTASSIIAGFARSRVTIRRGSPATFVDGRAVPGTVSIVKILAVVLPAKSARLRREEAGERLAGAVNVYSSDPIYAARDTGEPADVLEWGGAMYELDEVDPFPGGLFVALATRRRVIG